MNINELFENIQDRFSLDELNGEFTLHGNCIVWEYELNDDNQNLSSTTYDDDDEFDYDTNSPEELLIEAYNNDYELLEVFLDEIDELDNWTISDSEIIDEIISFKIF